MAGHRWKTSTLTISGFKKKGEREILFYGIKGKTGRGKRDVIRCRGQQG